MREYYIELLGEKYLVRIAPRECFSDKWGIEGKCVHIFPGEGEAFSLASCGGEKATSEELFLVGVAHFSAVCKLPPTTLELEAEGIVRNIEIFSTDAGVLPLSFLKCKILYTKVICFSDLTEHPTAAVDCSGEVIRVLLAASSRGFDSAVLPRLLIPPGERAAVGCAVLFENGEVITYPGEKRLAALAAAAACRGENIYEMKSRAELVRCGDMPAVTTPGKITPTNLS